MTKRILGILLSTVAAIAFPAVAAAQSSLIEAEQAQEAAEAVASYADEDDLDDELMSPVVDNELKPYIVNYMRSIAQALYRENTEVETMRGAEVIVATIPTDNLFYPNEAVLLPGAETYLNRFNRYFEPAGKLKLVMTIHTDDTGSPEYSLDLSEERIKAIIDYYENSGRDVTSVVGFPRGQSDPLESNASRAGRALNRRFEVFIIPDELLLTEARLHIK